MGFGIDKVKESGFNFEEMSEIQQVLTKVQEKSQRRASQPDSVLKRQKLTSMRTTTNKSLLSNSGEERQNKDLTVQQKYCIPESQLIKMPDVDQDPNPFGWKPLASSY